MEKINRRKFLRRYVLPVLVAGAGSLWFLDPKNQKMDPNDLGEVLKKYDFVYGGGTDVSYNFRGSYGLVSEISDMPKPWMHGPYDMTNPRTNHDEKNLNEMKELKKVFENTQVAYSTNFNGLGEGNIVFIFAKSRKMQDGSYWSLAGYTRTDQKGNLEFSISLDDRLTDVYELAAVNPRNKKYKMLAP